MANITFAKAHELLPNAVHIYADVTEEELNAIEVPKYVTKIDDVTVLGTVEEQHQLSAKEIIGGTMSFG